MEPREDLGRMLRNLKGIYGESDLERAMRMHQRLVELFPRRLRYRMRARRFVSRRPTARRLALKTLQAWLRRRPELAEADRLQREPSQRRPGIRSRQLIWP